jgi:hypothetical protein
MKILRILLLGASALLLLASTASADTVVTGNGTWGDNTPLTPESAPGATWAFSFTIADPVTDAVDLTGAFETQQVAGLVYLLNGTQIPVTLLDVRFFDLADMGMFDLDLSDGNVVAFFGDQVYAGNPPPNLTLIDGNYSADGSMNEGDPTTTGTITIVSAPEPATVSLLSIALFGLLLTRFYKIHAKPISS